MAQCDMCTCIAIKKKLKLDQFLDLAIETNRKYSHFSFQNEKKTWSKIEPHLCPFVQKYNIQLIFNQING